MCKWRMLDSFEQHQIVDAMGQHKKKCSNWEFGSVQKYWTEKTEKGETILCIQYESGNVWHYHRSQNNVMNIF